MIRRLLRLIVVVHELIQEIAIVIFSIRIGPVDLNAQVGFFARSAVGACLLLRVFGVVENGYIEQVHQLLNIDLFFNLICFPFVRLLRCKSATARWQHKAHVEAALVLTNEFDRYRVILRTVLIILQAKWSSGQTRLVFLFR